MAATRNFHSKWECPKCPKTYQSTVTGTRSVGHWYTKRDYHRMKRVWRSEYDKMKE